MIVKHLMGDYSVTCNDPGVHCPPETPLSRAAGGGIRRGKPLRSATARCSAVMLAAYQSAAKSHMPMETSGNSSALRSQRNRASGRGMTLHT